MPDSIVLSANGPKPSPPFARRLLRAAWLPVLVAVVAQFAYPAVLFRVHRDWWVTVGLAHVGVLALLAALAGWLAVARGSSAWPLSMLAGALVIAVPYGVVLLLASLAGGDVWSKEPPTAWIGLAVMILAAAACGLLGALLATLARRLAR